MSSDTSSLSADQKRALLRELLEKQAGGARTLPASFAQQRLWFLERLDPGVPYYNMPIAIRMSGPLNAGILRKALDAIIARHDALRTSFTEVNDEAMQVIAPAVDWDFRVEDLERYPENERERIALAIATEEDGKAFALDRAPLFRCVLVRLNAADHLFVMIMNHIIGDGWSLGILFRELAEIYGAFSSGRTPELPPLQLQYSDFSIWQRNQINAGAFDGQLDYWKKQLAAPLPILDLPADRPRPTHQSLRGARHHFRLESGLERKLRTLAASAGATPFMAVLTALKVLLHRYTGRTDLIVGTPVANRNRTEIENVMGFFVNTLALRTDLSGNPTFHEALGRVRATALGATANQDLPFEKLVENIQVDRQLSRTPVFQVMLVFQNVDMQTHPLGDVTAKLVEVTNKTAKFDLTLVLFDDPAGLRGYFEYYTDLFDAGTVARMENHFQAILRVMVAEPDGRVGSVNILSAAERNRIVVEWNQTGQSRPNRPVHEFLEEHAASQPDSLCLWNGSRGFTYSEVNSRADAVAEALVKAGAGPGSIVGLSADRSLDRIAGMFGTWKAGAAYLPLDPNYPESRLGFMLDDAEARFILAQEWALPKLPAGGRTVLTLESIPASASTRSQTSVRPEDAAYIIYTSGSTGQPKGVVVEHRGLPNMALSEVDCFAMTPSDRCLHLASLSFDASVFEIAGPIAAGAAIVFGEPEDMAPGPSLVRWLRENHVTWMVAPPSIVAAMRVADPATELPELKTLIVAGEVCPRDLAAQWRRGRRFFNAYGPTEATVWATLAEIRADRDRVAIGTPIPNVRVYIVDPELQPVPLGVAGEICIGGAGVAREYWNRSELTAARFVTLPSIPEAGRVYRSGDMGRYLVDGAIEYLGRIDNQVKVRGFRIELDEIDRVLRGQPGIRECVVVVREDRPGDSQIVAYVVPGQPAPSASDLRLRLKNILPDYMTPSAFVSLETLPLTSNGKVDRQALPKPDRLGSREFVAPRTPLESGIAEIWQELLKLDRIGIDDNFFELGGHSLRAAQMQSRINARFAVAVPLLRLFETPTVAGLALAVLEQQAGNTDEEELERLLAEVENLPG